MTSILLIIAIPVFIKQFHVLYLLDGHPSNNWDEEPSACAVFGEWFSAQYALDVNHTKVTILMTSQVAMLEEK